MSTAKYHHGDLKAEIIKVATEKLRNEGPEAVTLRGLAAELDVSRTAPYRHFKDKNELMSAIAKEGFALFSRCLGDAWVENETIATIDRFKVVADAYISFSLSYPEYYTLMFGTSALLKHPSATLKEQADSSFMQLRNMLAHCQKDGSFLEEDTLLQARFVWSSMHGYCSILLDNAEEKSAMMLEEKDYFINKIVIALQPK